MEMEENDQKDIDQIEVESNEAFTDDTFTEYRRLTMARWAGECLDVFTNKIKQLVGLARLEGAGMERLTKLTFVTGFSDTISIRLRQVPNIETLTMGDLRVRGRVLTITGD